MAKAKKSKSGNKIWHILGLSRITLGFVFLWPFFDKLFGLGFSTCRDAKTSEVTTMCSKAWIHGGSPTTGFLKFAAKGPFKGFYNGLAGNHLVDVVFMVALLLIGVALIAGIATKLATIGGSLLLFMMWTAALLPENNPILDEHIVYILVLMLVLHGNDNQKFGLKDWWAKQTLTKKLPILK